MGPDRASGRDAGAQNMAKDATLHRALERQMGERGALDGGDGRRASSLAAKGCCTD